MFVDPFVGSGTSLVEGLLAGRRAVGIDLNPLAVAVAEAKIQDVTLEDVTARLLTLAAGFRGVADTEHVPEGLWTIFHPRTLTQLAYLQRVSGPFSSRGRFHSRCYFGNHAWKVAKR